MALVAIQIRYPEGRGSGHKKPTGSGAMVGRGCNQEWSGVFNERVFMP